MAYLSNRILHPDSKAMELGHPWKIYLSKNAANRTVFGIEYQSDVYDGFDWDKKTVTGLVTRRDDIDDPGWKIPTEGYIFLWGEIDEDGVIGKIEVKNDQQELENIYRAKVNSEGKQTHFAHTLGYIWKTSDEPGSDTWLVRQDANRHLTMIYVVINGVACKIPFEM
jgi:hypothetical protein